MHIEPALKKSDDLLDKAVLLSIAGAVVITYAVKAAYSAHLASDDAAVLLGVILLTAAVFRSIPAFFGAKRDVWLGAAALAVPGIVAGLALVIEPHITFATYTGLAASYLAVNGILAIGYPKLRKPADSGRYLAASLASLALAASVLAHWPVAGVWGVSLALGASLLIDGALLISLGVSSLRASRAHRETLRTTELVEKKGVV